MARLHGKNRGTYRIKNSAGAWRYYVRMSDGNGNLVRYGKPRGWATLTEAKNFYDYRIAKMRDALLRPELQNRTKATVGELCQEYLASIPHLKAFKDQVRYAAYWTEYFGPRQVLTITASDVRKAMTELSRNGRHRCRSAATINRFVAFLKHLLRVTVRPRSR